MSSDAQNVFNVRNLLDTTVGNAITIAAIGVALVLVSPRYTTAQKKVMRTMGIITVGVGLMVGVVASVDYVSFLLGLPRHDANDKLPTCLRRWRLWTHVMLYVGVAIVLLVSGAYYWYAKVYSVRR